MGILEKLAPYGGLISAGSNIAGSIIQNVGNQKLANKAQAYELEMWNRSNEYNSPMAQMARLKQAGLNPNLVYGTGNVSGQSSSPAPKAHVPEYQSPLGNNLGFNVLNALLDTEKTRAQTDLIAENNKRLVMQNEILKEFASWHPGNLQGQSLVNKNSLLFADLTNKTQNLYPYSAKLNEILLEQAKNQALGTQYGTEIKGIDLNVAKATEDFKKSNPYLGMLLSLLGSFSGLNMMSGTPFGKKSNPGVVNNRTVNVINKPLKK